jgi:hypothetical protein
MEGEFGKLKLAKELIIMLILLTRLAANAWLDTLGEIKERSGSNNE